MATEKIEPTNEGRALVLVTQVNEKTILYNFKIKLKSKKIVLFVPSSVEISNKTGTRFENH